MAARKGRGIQMQRHGWTKRWIAHLVVSGAIGNVGKLAALVPRIQGAFQPAIVLDLSNFTLQNLEPASVARMIVDWRFLESIPTQQQQRICLVVGRNQVARVGFSGIKMGVLLPGCCGEVRSAE
eukprot:CAMPEP_0168163428 /NCGR_PEP_ID=MMETSP0139_2-20121125/373_1 /TAXON_ID=44445 /ORGANISM="Pseudo-nitzschia australis, Strain 10249 10 AB" /LENGTH=123 /DNA_ID=CAMNT_0008080327 /DNA_START=274 /DNA_END=645 /DNA_ORIENTATION=+